MCVNNLRVWLKHGYRSAWWAGVAVSMFLGAGMYVWAQNPHDDPVMARWNLHVSNGVVIETVSGSRAQVKGNVYAASGPTAAALQFDGYTAEIIAPPVPALDHPRELGISAWIELNAYPWNLAPILDQQTPAGSFFFGMDATGHLVARTSTASAISEQVIPLRKWTLVTLGIENDENKKISFTVDGSPIATRAEPLIPTQDKSSENNLLIGYVRTALLPAPENRIHPNLPVRYSIEGALSDLTVYRFQLSAKAVSELLHSAALDTLKPIPWPQLPRWSGGSGSFGAFYTTLHFDPLWDGTRRIAPDSDVVVRFDDSPVQLIFWQGANYVPAWVTENNNWYTDEFMEIYGHPRCPYGEDCEPMSDKQSRYSHVRILESTPARTVVHWRYALSEVEQYAIGNAPSPTAWGDWADEYWTIYPDHTAVRKSVLWSTAEDRDKTEFQESIVMIPPGKTPEDCLNLDALSFANMSGETKAYTWEQKNTQGLQMPKGPSSFPEPKKAVIQRVNLRSEWKPFEVLWGDDVSSDSYNGEPSLSSFEWWNHWPVAQIPSSGRPALAADRPGHTSVSHLYWPAYQKTEMTLTKLLMTGLTTLPANQLVPLAKSWRSPPQIRAQDGTVLNYDTAQRAYIVPATLAAPLQLTLEGSAEHPVYHPAFVLEGWTREAKVSVIRGAATDGLIRQGVVEDLSGRRLVIYLPLVAEDSVQINLDKP
jgi:hypothetical protein